MKILVTGAAGFLGSHISEKLINLGHQVTGVDNLIGGYKENLPSGLIFHQVDLLHYDDLGKVFDEQEIVIHAACTAYEGLSVFSPALIVANTLQITVNALSWAVRSGAKKFVYLSSMARYGTQDKIPFTEEMTPRPQDPYGIAKYSAEKLVENICTTHNMQYVILVPHNIIGPRQKFDDPYRNVASIMINRMLQGQAPIIYGDGEQKRCFSFISDVVTPLINSIFNEQAVGKIINIGPDEEFVSINELAKSIAKILNSELSPIYVDERPQEVKNATCSANLARQLFGYKTTVGLEAGLSELALYIKARGPKPFDYNLPLEINNELTPKTWVDKII